MGLRPADKLCDFDHKSFNVMCGKLGLALASRNLQQAHSLVSDFASEMSRPIRVVASDPVAWVLPPQVAAALEERGYLTVQSVDQASDEDIEAVCQIGTVRIRKLRSTLASHGFNGPKVMA